MTYDDLVGSIIFEERKDSNKKPWSSLLILKIWDINMYQCTVRFYNIRNKETILWTTDKDVVKTLMNSGHYNGGYFTLKLEKT